MHNAEADAEHVNAALRLRGNYIKSRRQYLEPYCPCNGYRFKKRKVKIIVRDCTNEQLRSLPLVIKTTHCAALIAIGFTAGKKDAPTFLHAIWSSLGARQDIVPHFKKEF